MGYKLRFLRLQRLLIPVSFVLILEKYREHSYPVPVVIEILCKYICPHAMQNVYEICCTNQIVELKHINDGLI